MYAARVHLLIYELQKDVVKLWYAAYFSLVKRKEPIGMSEFVYLILFFIFFLFFCALNGAYFVIELSKQPQKQCPT